MVVKAAPTGQAHSARRVDKRRAILDAATALFAERGFGGVSVQEIADAAETHKATVLYHFATKEALHEAVLDEALGAIAGVMREFLAGELSRERTAYLLDQNHTFFAEHPQYARLLERELLESAADAYLDRFIEPIYRPALRSLERGMKAGRIRRIDPALFIHDLHVEMIGYFCHGPMLAKLKPGRDPFSIESLIERRNHLLDQIFRQLTPDAAMAKGGAR